VKVISMPAYHVAGQNPDGDFECRADDEVVGRSVNSFPWYVRQVRDGIIDCHHKIGAGDQRPVSGDRYRA